MNKRLGLIPRRSRHPPRYELSRSSTTPRVFPHFASARLYLIRSLHLLEDLALSSQDCWIDEGKSEGLTVYPPSTPTPLSETLAFLRRRDEARTTRLLPGPPGGLHFRKMKLEQYEVGDFCFVPGALVAACSDTLESLNIGCEMTGTFGPVSWL